ncbi:hypothetical protein [Streptomyces sp. ISL-11]|nr:hypothetical protein [Streptomyces sp. ISL-11]MBT2384607.1 hypothetical protein [Streptomyces sp. ISL-11]
MRGLLLRGVLAAVLAAGGAIAAPAAAAVSAPAGHGSAVRPLDVRAALR